jgi:hypothetical protein
MASDYRSWPNAAPHHNLSKSLKLDIIMEALDAALASLALSD